MDIHDLTAAYALDALDADETREYEAHLAQCVALPRGSLDALGVGDGARLGRRRAAAAERPARADPLRGGGRARERRPASCPQSLGPAHDGGDRRGRSLHRGRPRDLGDLALALREPGAVCARGRCRRPRDPLRPGHAPRAARRRQRRRRGRPDGTGRARRRPSRLGSVGQDVRGLGDSPGRSPQGRRDLRAAAATRRSSGSSIRSRAAR